MTDKQKSLALSAVVFTLAIGVSVCLTIFLLYKTALDEETQRLRETVKSHARLIEAVSRFSRQHLDDHFDGGWFAATLEQVRDAHNQNEGFGETGEFTLGAIEKGTIKFLLPLKFPGAHDAAPLSMTSFLAEPMRKALFGNRGTLIGPDYRGKSVLAAYEPMEELGLGLVAKIDLSEIRQPFIKTILIVGVSNLAIIIVSTILLLRFNPFLRKLEQTKIQFQATFEQAAVGIAHVGLDGRWLRVNRKLCEIIGYSKEEIVFRTFQDITHPDDLKKDLGYMNQLIDGQRDTYSMEKRYYRKDGSVIWVNLTVAVIRDGHARPLYFVSVVEDIQKRKEGEKNLKEAKKMLEQSNQDLDDFAYIVSHDLQEPLRGIMNYSTFIIEDHADQIDDEGKAKFETIQNLTQRLSHLIQDLLIYSRVSRQEASFQLTDLNTLVQDVLSILKPRIEEESIEIRLNIKLPEIYCNKVNLQEVFFNLITNAIKYNDKENKWIEIGAVSDLQKYPGQIFYVRDNGIGILEKHLEKVFTVFKRLHAKNKFGGGTGAGLAITKKIIEKHNGRIWVESVFGQGSTFYFTVGEDT